MTILVLPKKTFTVNDTELIAGKYQEISCHMYQWLLTCENVSDYLDEHDAGLVTTRRATEIERVREVRRKHLEKLEAEKLEQQQLEVERQNKERLDKESRIQEKIEAIRQACEQQREADRKYKETQRANRRQKRALNQLRKSKSQIQQKKGYKPKKHLKAQSTSAICDVAINRRWLNDDKTLGSSGISHIPDSEGCGYDESSFSLFRGYTSHGLQISEGGYWHKARWS